MDKINNIRGLANDFNGKPKNKTNYQIKEF